jgi:hypothetical protein
VEPSDLARRSAELLEAAATSGWRGPDPYDGLWWPWPAFLTGGRRQRQAIIQLHARAPVDIRRLRRREPPVIAKALGVFGSAAVRLRRLTGDERFERSASDALSTLDADRSAGADAWGYPFDVQTRWSFNPAGSPNVVVTAFAAKGLAEGADELSEPRFHTRARDAARWVLDELYLPRGGFFAYHPGSDALIHNASLLGARAVHVLLPAGAASKQVSSAVELALAAQRADGSWPYGEAANLAWSDSFHTGYVLICLARMRQVDPRIDDALTRGAGHYACFFDPAGRALLWAGKPHPEDGHSAGTGLTTLALLHRRGLVGRESLERVARRVLGAGLQRGHVVHRRYRRGRTTVRYLRWCDAHVALGLVDAAAALSGAEDLAPRSEALG